MPPNSSSTNRWVALDAMRGLAALLVVLYHLRWSWHGFGLIPVRHGFYAVDFFFVLSGFVMAATYGGMRSQIDLVCFALKRAGRLLPLHFAMLAVFLALELAFTLANYTGLFAGRPTFAGFTAPLPLLAQLTLTFGLIPGLDWLWNHPCWSIAIEFWTYILFGLTVLILRRGRLFVWAGLSMLGLAVVATIPDGLASTSGPAIFRGLLSFFLGALVYAAYASLRARGVVIGVSLQILLAGLAAVAIGQPPTAAGSLVIPLVLAGLVLCFAFDEGGIAKALGIRPLRWLGELSFSIYLVHVPLWFAIEGVLRLCSAAGVTWLLPDADVALPGKVSPFGSTWAADALVLAYVGLVLGVAAWTHRWIETPSRQWSRRIADEIMRASHRQTRSAISLAVSSAITVRLWKRA